MYKPAERNMNGVQFEKIRKIVDKKWNDFHDALSACYYNTPEQEFVYQGKNYGVLDKAKFDELHGLLFVYLEVDFHNANIALPEADRIPEDQYRYHGKSPDLIDRVAENMKQINDKKAQGIELVVS